MNAEFFVLAFTAALNPKLLALDLLLIENRRPRAMFLCVLLGGMTVALTIGLLDVLTVHADAIKSQGKASAGVDLAVGLLLLTVGGLLATGRLHGRKRSPVPAGNMPPEQPEQGSWARGWPASWLAWATPCRLMASIALAWAPTVTVSRPGTRSADLTPALAPTLGSQIR